MENKTLPLLWIELHWRQLSVTEERKGHPLGYRLGRVVCVCVCVGFQIEFISLLSKGNSNFKRK